MSSLELKQQLNAYLPYGMIATRKWLSAQKMSRHTIDNALKSNKLESLAVGVYTRTGMPTSWQGVICSLQHMDEQPIVVGGLSALELLGFGHYLSESKPEIIHLYSETRFPGWLGKLKLDVIFEWHGTRTLWLLELLPERLHVREYTWREDLPPLKISCPEKACFEMLMDVPNKISFDHANEIMQGMTNLSPKKLEALLKVCRSVKVKRLFFWLAERQGYSWCKKLDADDFDLGKGKRVIAKGGKLDKKYLITVPERLYGEN